MEIGFQVPPGQLERLLAYGECRFPQHREMMLFPWSHAQEFKILRKASLHLAWAALTLLQGAFIYYSLPPVIPNLTFPLPPQKKLCHLLLWSLKISKAPPSQVGKNPCAHIKAQIPVFLLPGSCRKQCVHIIILRKWGCLAELDPLSPFTELPLCPG